MTFTHKILLVFILVCSQLTTTHAAATKGQTTYIGNIQEVSTVTRLIVVKNRPFKLAIGVKVHDPDDPKMAGIYNLRLGQRIKFITKINRYTRKEEIYELWIERL